MSLADLETPMDTNEFIRNSSAHSPEELAPFEERNSLKALAALWQVMNGLDMDPGQVYDLGA